MTDDNQKFVEEMLKRAQEKKKTEAQKRTEGVDREKVENIVDNLINPAKKEKKEEVSSCFKKRRNLKWQKRKQKKLLRSLFLRKIK